MSDTREMPEGANESGETAKQRAPRGAPPTSPAPPVGRAQALGVEAASGAATWDAAPAELDLDAAPERGAWGRLRAWAAALPRWQKALFTLATVFLLAGGVTALVEDAGPARARPAEHAARQPDPGSAMERTGPLLPETRQSFLPTEEGPRVPGTGAPPPAQAQDSAVDPWSAGFFRLGFSFFAGFSIGFALRSILKLVTLGIGIALLFLMLLGYFDLIEVKWARIDVLFESLGGRISSEAERFQSFITGSLPSTGLAATGLFAGLRRRR